MAQQVFSQYVPLARTGPNPQDTIPVVAAIAQSRDGKDELLLGNVPFVPGSGGLYVPVSASNRLPVEATLSGSDVQIEVTQLLNAEPLSAGASISREFDLQTYGELVAWVAIDRQYSLQFYQQLTSGGTNLPIAVTIADNVSPPALGRTHVYNITQYLPAHTGRLLVSNRNTTETATVSLWIGRVKRL